MKNEKLFFVLIIFATHHLPPSYTTSVFFSIFNFFYPIPLYFFSQLVFLINNIALIMKKKDKKNCRKNEQKKIYKS
jgi:nucleoside recognition membrane protein YjiH